jgi:hypothetical protein
MVPFVRVSVSAKTLGKPKRARLLIPSLALDELIQRIGPLHQVEPLGAYLAVSCRGLLVHTPPRYNDQTIHSSIHEEDFIGHVVAVRNQRSDGITDDRVIRGSDIVILQNQN